MHDANGIGGTAVDELRGHRIEGLVIGQAFADDAHSVVRVVAIDPVMHSVEAEDPAGAVIVDDIAHFTATHAPLAE